MLKKTLVWAPDARGDLVKLLDIFAGHSKNGVLNQQQLVFVIDSRCASIANYYGYHYFEINARWQRDCSWLVKLLMTCKTSLLLLLAGIVCKKLMVPLLRREDKYIVRFLELLGKKVIYGNVGIENEYSQLLGIATSNLIGEKSNGLGEIINRQISEISKAANSKNETNSVYYRASISRLKQTKVTSSRGGALIVLSGSSPQKSISHETCEKLSILLDESGTSSEVVEWSRHLNLYLYSNGLPEPRLSSTDLSITLNYLEQYALVIVGDSYMAHLVRTDAAKNIMSVVVLNGATSFLYDPNLQRSRVTPSRSERCPSYPCANLGGRSCKLECTPTPEEIVNDCRSLLLLRPC